MKTIINIDGIELSVFMVEGILQVNMDNQMPSRYCASKDEKWIKFCKDHKFNPVKDVNSKIYNLYLDMCAEGLI